MLFHQIFMNVYDITNINSVIINRKIAHISIQSIFFFFMWSCYQLFEIFPVCKKWIWFYFRNFYYELIDFLRMQKTVACTVMQTSTNVLSWLVIYTDYLASPRTKVSFFFLYKYVLMKYYLLQKKLTEFIIW